MGATAQIIEFPSSEPGTFEEAWKALPASMRARSDKKAACELLWRREAKRLGGERMLAKPNVELARLVSAVGAKRSPAAVKTRRLRIEAAKPPIVPRKANEWPVVNGDWEQQSERFRVRLLEEMLKEVRSRRA